jgi:hypothetical protein
VSENQERHTEQCGVCGRELTYLEEGRPSVCSLCGQSEIGHVYCTRGHYLCESCHGAGVQELLPQLLHASRATSPQELAEELMALPQLPMLGCEHALIAAGSLMTALKNRVDIGVTERHVAEALQRTERQAISAYCGLSGVCGVVPALGACYSVLVGAQCGKGPETRATMELVSRLAAVTAEEAEPGCCKAFVRSCLAETERFLEERLGIPFSEAKLIICRDAERHPHGCRGSGCDYHPERGFQRPHERQPGLTAHASEDARSPSSFAACSVVEAAAGS